MADTTSTESNTDAQALPETETVDWKAEAEKWKSLSRKNEDQAKANADKARAYDELQEQSKSELQKAIERAEAAEKRATAAETDSLRARIAAAKGINVGLLTGTTEDEINASADALLAWKGQASAPDNTGHSAPTPPASTSSTVAGARGDTVSGPKQLSREDLKTMSPKQIVQARLNGELDSILGAGGATS
ncbi:MAG: hypothetical protein E7K79_09565 [Actinomyces urogenitalis]|nr:hypothetical protein [Actinomyces urogenitalis]